MTRAAPIFRFYALALALAFTGLAGGRAQAQSAQDLQQMSISQLADINVSSVTKSPEALSAAPGSIFVITHEDIVRSGAQSLPQILRLAPNLEVFQTSASQFVVTARGMSGSSADQNFSNKLLVLIDGRTVYTPLYSGVYWDMQDVLPEDVERIEVISGPGAALWGANAVNGVINIITRKSSDTQGLFADVTGGDRETTAGVRYGGSAGEDLTYRIYAHAVRDEDGVLLQGQKADDGWSRVQGGFRADWTASPADTATLQGDLYRGVEQQDGSPDSVLRGANVLGRWTHDFQDAGSLQVQAYYDQAFRMGEDSGGAFTVNTYDLEIQHNFSLGASNALVWGGGLRSVQYRVEGTPSLFVVPAGRTLDQADLFGQDTIALARKLDLILGLKLEEDAYSGLALLPNVRLSWRPAKGATIWLAVSRAIRSPTPFDRDVMEKIGDTVALIGDSDFKPECVIAYELGFRLQPSTRLSLSLSTFYNSYQDLRTVDPAPGTFFPLTWGNGMRGDTYGFESWADYRVAPWWRLSAGLTVLEEHLTFTSPATALLGPAQAGDDPEHQAHLKSSMNLARNITLDADLRYVDALPSPAVPAYVELNGRLAWGVTDRLELAVDGFNLLHDRHQEFPGAEAIPREVAAELRWRY